MTEIDDYMGELKRLLDSGVRVKRLRVLRVECSHHHELAQVIRLLGDYVVLYKSVVVRQSATADDDDRQTVPWRDGAPIKSIRYEADQSYAPLSSAEPGAYAVVSNACCAYPLYVDWMLERISRGIRRGVAPRA